MDRSNVEGCSDCGNDMVRVAGAGEMEELSRWVCPNCEDMDVAYL